MNISSNLVLDLHLDPDLVDAIQENYITELFM